MTRTDADELAKRQILGCTEAVLAKADVIGVLPTPLEAVARAADIIEVVDIGHLPEALAKQRPSSLKRILGALFYKERVAYVDFAQSDARARLTEAHEIGHKVIPWHQGAFQLDDLERVAGRTQDRLENEAYLAGGHLLFQGSRFHKKALEYKISLKTPILLSAEYGASYHATIRYYVSHHPEAVALLVAGKYLHEQSVPIWHSIESQSFLRRFGKLVPSPNGRLAVAQGSVQPFGDVAHRAMSLAEVAADTVRLTDQRGENHEFTAESFYNQHNLFVMVAESKVTRRLGRAVRVVAS